MQSGLDKSNYLLTPYGSATASSFCGGGEWVVGAAVEHPVNLKPLYDCDESQPFIKRGHLAHGCPTRVLIAPAPPPRGPLCVLPAGMDHEVEVHWAGLRPTRGRRNCHQRANSAGPNKMGRM
ncbi:hypothetical protein CRG98_040229 [Punica granatum]|uniref:Uncharacterized protein n=1 Tax=Punica granatum TaxID=22663 RepID=A0A2I0I6C6_PUNGR|nr:hypothetical protein CRG98_040229 [Punica granatum]